MSTVHSPRQSPQHRVNPLIASRFQQLDGLQPLAIGYSVVRGSRAIHWQNEQRDSEGHGPYCLLQYTTAGAGWLNDSSGKHRIGPGQAFLIEIPSPTTYRLPFGASWEWVWLNFRGAEASRLVRQINATLGHVLDLTGQDCARMLCDFYDNRVTEKVSSPWTQSMQLYQLLVGLTKLAANAKPASTLPAAIVRSLDHIRQHATDPDLGLPTLAEQAGVSRFHLARLFRQHLGCSPSQRLREERLHRAQHLLAYTDLSVADIATQSGFSSPAYFGATFRKHFGRSPGSIRR
jgi:AraC-like DNA-binding protein